MTELITMLISTSLLRLSFTNASNATAVSKRGLFSTQIVPFTGKVCLLRVCVGVRFEC